MHVRAPLDVTFAALLDRVGHQERAGDFEKRRPLYRSHVTPEVAVIVRTHGAIFSLATARASYVSSGCSYTHARLKEGAEALRGGRGAVQ